MPQSQMDMFHTLVAASALWWNQIFFSHLYVNKAPHQEDKE
jgi:hypothetical protein